MFLALIALTVQISTRNYEIVIIILWVYVLVNGSWNLKK